MPKLSELNEAKSPQLIKMLLREPMVTWRAIRVIGKSRVEKKTVWVSNVSWVIKESHTSILAERAKNKRGCPWGRRLNPRSGRLYDLLESRCTGQVEPLPISGHRRARF